VDERRVTKHRRTLNERRGSASEDTTRGRKTPAARSARGSRKSRVSEDLMRLACLWQAGALSDAEFEAAKARVLATYWGNQTSA
jgi:hypothetical protein